MTVALGGLNKLEFLIEGTQVLHLDPLWNLKFQEPLAKCCVEFSLIE